MQFGERLGKFPAQPHVQRESRVDSPVVVDKRVVAPPAKVFIGIAKSDRGRVRNAEQEIREIGAGSSHGKAVGHGLRGRAGKGKRAARVLLREDVELLPPDVTTEGDTVAAAVPQAVVGKCLRLVGVPRVFEVRKVPPRRWRRSGSADPSSTAPGHCPKCRLRRTRCVRFAKYGVTSVARRLNSYLK